MIAAARVFAAAALVCASAAAMAADVRVLSSVGMRGVLEQLQPEFERASAHKVVFTFGTAAPLKRRIDEGAGFDATVLTPPLVADLANSGKVDARSVTKIARSGVGLAGRKDAAAPDIASADALKRTLLAARSVAYTKEGASGVAAAKLIERLGIAPQMQPRVLVETRSGGSLAAIVEGKAELGFALLSEIVPDPHVKLVGALPGELQSFVEFAAAVSSQASDAAAANAFIEFMRGDTARKTLAANGMEPM